MAKVALIIPAFNEEDRIGNVLLAAVRRGRLGRHQPLGGGAGNGAARGQRAGHRLVPVRDLCKVVVRLPL